MIFSSFDLDEDSKVTIKKVGDKESMLISNGQGDNSGAIFIVGTKEMLSKLANSILKNCNSGGGDE